MRIGLLGTRGIPNRYGGFEELADQVCLYWANLGHQVVVYCEDNDMKEIYSYNNVTQVFIKPGFISPLSQFVYDYRCTKDALQRELDIVYHAGYATSVVGNRLLQTGLKGKLVYNMDGLEWKRSKFNRLTRWVTKELEKMAVHSGAGLISDNKGIQNYLRSTYGIESALIEYGANPLDAKSKSFDSYPKIFDLVIARFEPENHIEEIISAYRNNKNLHLVLVANIGTKLYKKLAGQLKDAMNITFNGPIYDKEELAYLKTNCRYYIHGHSVGGTNPSLLEALAAGCNILIHGNEFNKDVVAEHAQCWSSQKELEQLISSPVNRSSPVVSQKQYCSDRFNWEVIAKKHIDYFESMSTCKR